ncbi:unnamed protein product [Bursaphelenchus xylophilus]|uniref:oleoyl-[acyl-carrier-protein] hydrolase n=1 Tax=Bursaphelenchus xylophilus TaxID=6326 RepID=A0A7I8WQP1_BURXY|nr:unnamed protein product [Bursaphelenchus xylophilus]CAG9097143.1 unnamed protein product [Bursaphelenchus xylophilus]
MGESQSPAQVDAGGESVFLVEGPPTKGTFEKCLTEDGLLKLLLEFFISCEIGVEENRVTHAYIMPAFLNNLPDHYYSTLFKLKLIQFGGERISPRFIEKALNSNPDCKFCQLFGFTEHAIYSNYQWINDISDIDYVGMPFANTSVKCLDNRYQKVDYNQIGFLFTAGIGLSEAGQSGNYINLDGEWVYRTGDLCEFTIKGVKFTGRSDDCEKVRGHMINPTDIDKTIEKSGLCHQNVTVICEERGENLIVSYLKLKSNRTIEEMRRYLQKSLKTYMIPSYIIQIQEFLLNSNGKVDKKWLKNNFKEYLKERRPDLNDSEDVFLSIFQEIFGDNIKYDSNLYNYGVDSLKLLNLMHRLEEKLDLKFDFKQIMGVKTPRQLKNCLEIDQRVEPTYNQEHIWLLRDLNPEILDYYWVTVTLKFNEIIDQEKFIKVIDAIVEGNESLKYTVTIDEKGLFLKKIEDSEDKLVKWRFIDEKRVQIQVDHMAIDGFSLGILTKLLAENYKSKKIKKISAPSFLQYAKRIRKKDMTDSRDYWINRLKPVISKRLPVQFASNSTPKYSIFYEKFKLRSVEGCTIFQTIIAAMIKQIHLESNQDEFIVGIPVLNREKDEMELIGYLANTLPIVFRYFEDPEKMIKDIKETMANLRNHSEYPIQLLKRDLNLKSDEIIQRMVSFEDFHLTQVQDFFSIEEGENNYLKFEECWYFWIEDDELRLKLEYDGSKFSVTYIENQIKTFRQALNQNKIEKSTSSDDHDDLEASIYYEASSNPIEEQSSQILSEILKIYRDELNSNNFTITDNFFDFGGHSLTASKISNKIRKNLVLKCPTKFIFEFQTVRELAERLLMQKQMKEISFLEKTLLKSIQRASPSVKNAYFHRIQVEITDFKVAKERILKLINSQEILRSEFIRNDDDFKVIVHPEINEISFPYKVKSPDLGLETVNIAVEDDKLHIKIHHICADGYSMKIMEKILLNLPINGHKIDDLRRKLNKKYKENQENCQKFWENYLTAKNVNSEVMLVFGDEKIDGEHDAKYPMTFFVALLDDKITIDCVFMDFWNEDTVYSILKTLQCYLQQQDLAPVPHKEDKFDLVDPIFQIINKCREYPAKIALRSPSYTVTYQELYRKIIEISANIKRHFIQTYGQNLTADTVICIMTENRLDGILALLATVLSGAAYLFVDPETPEYRLNRIIETSNGRILISTRPINHPKFVNYHDLIGGTHQTTDCHTFLSDLCYVIYTSGSTGSPKAVAIERKSLANTLIDATEFMSVDSNSTLLQFTKLCFDNSVLEIFLALTNGSTLFIYEEIFSSELFAEYLTKYNITHAFLFPGLVSSFDESQIKSMACLDYWIVGAEPLSQKLLDQALKCNINIIQNYGPTETTCYSLRKVMKAGDESNNLGSSVINTQCLVMNNIKSNINDGNSNVLNIDSKATDFVSNVPALSAPRQLLIGGSGIMRGYLGTQDKPFVIVNGNKYYKSGDMVRLTEKGDILFCGRMDSQIKVRGFRVDLLEIEKTINQIKGISDVKVLVIDDNIYAYYVSNEVILPADIKDYCKRRLASYAIPGRYVKVALMPLTPNNKVDKEKLKMMDTQGNNRPILTEKDERLPHEKGKMEEIGSKRAIRRIWGEILGYDDIRDDDDFFEVGANSLTATKLLNKLKDIRIHISFEDFIQDPTVNGIYSNQKINNTVNSYTNQNFGLLSYQQEQIYFLNLLNDEYNVLFVQIFTHELDVKRLQGAINRVINKNKILRTKYTVNDDMPEQIVVENTVNLEVEECKNDDIREVVKKFGKSKLKMEDIPIKIKIFKSEDKYYLLLLMNHIATDATSTKLLEGKMSDEFNGISSRLPDLDYIDWAQNERKKEGKYKQMMTEFKDYYNSIKTDAFRDNKLENTKWIRFQRSYKCSNSNIFPLILTLISKSFKAMSDRPTKMIIGSPYHNRSPETAQTLGNFLNNLIILAEYDPNKSFDENLGINKDNIRRAMKFASLPFSFLKQVDPFNELFQVYVNCRYDLEEEASLKMDCAIQGGISLIDPIKHFPVECHIDQRRGQIQVEWLIPDDRKGIVEKFNEQFKKYLKQNLKEKARKIFGELLGSHSFTDGQQFFELGGNSLQLIRLKHQVRREMGIDIDLNRIIRDCSVNSILSVGYKDLVKVLNKGHNNVLILFPSIIGSFCYQKLTQKLLQNSPELTVILIELDDDIPTTLADLAQQNADLISNCFSKFEPINLNLAGFSFGAILAFETGQRLDFKFKNLISIDGIANSGVVNADITFEGHKNHMRSVASNFGISDSIENLINRSWDLLNLAKRYEIPLNVVPNFDRLEIIRTERKDYGWPFMDTITYGVRTLSSSHADLLGSHHEEVAFIIQKLF